MKKGDRITLKFANELYLLQTLYEDNGMFMCEVLKNISGPIFWKIGTSIRCADYEVKILKGQEKE